MGIGWIASGDIGDDSSAVAKPKNVARHRQPSSVAMAWAAMASPRPISPVPSFVLAFRLIWSGEMPSDFASAARMAGKCGPSFGRSQITTASRCLMRRLRSSSSFRVCSRKSRLEDALPFRIGIREMRADVAEARRAEQRVAKRVAQHIAIGMAHRAFVERNFDSADHQLAAFGQAVQIVADSGARHFARRS